MLNGWWETLFQFSHDIIVVDFVDYSPTCIMKWVHFWLFGSILHQPKKDMNESHLKCLVSKYERVGETEGVELAIFGAETFEIYCI